jgi:hypothetical protein
METGSLLLHIGNSFLLLKYFHYLFESLVICLSAHDLQMIIHLSLADTRPVITAFTLSSLFNSMY